MGQPHLPRPLEDNLPPLCSGEQIAPTPMTASRSYTIFIEELKGARPDLDVRPKQSFSRECDFCGALFSAERHDMRYCHNFLNHNPSPILKKSAHVTFAPLPQHGTTRRYFIGVIGKTAGGGATTQADHSYRPRHTRNR